MEPKILRYCSFSIILIINVLMIKSAKSEVYTVGEEGEWNTEVNFATWSKKYNFSVGDVLEFKYLKAQHDAYEVTEATFRSCDASTGVLAKYESGDDQVLLKEAKKYWFICNVAGHCLGGMRFTIDVKQTTPASTPQIQPTTPPSISCKSYLAFEKWSLLGIFLLASSILVLNL